MLPLIGALERGGGHWWHPASDGYDVVRVLPLVGIFCFIMPSTFSDVFSPKYGQHDSMLLTPGFFIVVGYFCLLVSAGVWMLFTAA